MSEDLRPKFGPWPKLSQAALETLKRSSRQPWIEAKVVTNLAEPEPIKPLSAAALRMFKRTPPTTT